MNRRSSLWLFPALLLLTTQVFADAPISVETYRVQLQSTEAQLRKMENKGPRKIAPVLKPVLNALSSDQIVRRADGQTQNAGGDEFRRILKELSLNPRREQTQQIREGISLRKIALDEWSRSTYAPADAQAIIRQLEGSGQIRTGPTQFEQWRANFNKWRAQTWKKFMTWLGSLFPAARPGKLPELDLKWVQAIYTITVLALLAAIGFFVWRAIGGKIGRKPQGAFAFSDEEAELLLLPPDELRERARKFAADGNFREALRHLYIALLLNLDARGVWRYDARRTNWEHIAALKTDASRSTLVAPLSDITRRFDRVRYGNATCEQNDWTEFERDVTALEASTPA